MTLRIARLGDKSKAPFRFRLGERVACKYYGGSAGEEVRGTITDGTCIYTVNGGTRLPPVYVVTCDDGTKITAAEMTLMLVRSQVSGPPE